MASLRTRKVVRDLRGNAGRTVLVVLSIMAGVFALSVTLRTRSVLARTVLESYAAIDPAAITILTTPFDASVVETVRQVPGVRAAEGQRHVQTRLRIGDDWYPLVLTAADFNAMRISRIAPDSGAWPPPAGEFGLERSYRGFGGIQLGDALTLQTVDGAERTLRVTGFAHDLLALPGQISSTVLFGYVSPEGLAALGAPTSFNELRIVVDDGSRTAEARQQIADRVGRRLEELGHPVVNTVVSDADQPAFYRTVEGVLVMLAALGVLSLLLSAFLVVNTMTGLLTQQVPQIGILKAIGASRRDLITLYLGMVLAMAALATCLGVALGAAVARWPTQQMGALINYDVTRYDVPAYVPALELFAGLLMPLGASLAPVVTGTRISVREALANQAPERPGSGALVERLGRSRRLPPTLLYALRNLFRRRARLALTLLALALAGTIVLSVLSVRASLFATLDAIAAYWQQDITVIFDQAHREDAIAAAMRQVPAVTGIAFQGDTLGVRVRPGGGESRDASVVFGVDPASPLLRPTVLEGRWLTPADTDALVVTVNFMEQEPDVALGDMVALRIGDRTTNWRVVGVVMTQVIDIVPPKIGQPNVYASRATLAGVLGTHGMANRALITTSHHDAAAQKQVARALDAQMGQSRLPGTLLTNDDARAQIAGTYQMITLVLLVMAVLFIVVGALGLSGAMSLNVFERSKELGLLRAVGASSPSIRRIVIAEALAVGVFSWLIAALLALPLSWVLSRLIGISLLKSPLVYRFPAGAIGLWLGLVVVLAILASYLPARSATLVTVRDVLSRE